MTDSNIDEAEDFSDVSMYLIDYIEDKYGNKRGNKAAFLSDNPHIIPQELSRWLKANLKVNLRTGEIYKPTSKGINLHGKKK